MSGFPAAKNWQTLCKMVEGRGPSGGCFCRSWEESRAYGGGRGIRQTYCRKGVGKESRTVRYTDREQEEDRKKGRQSNY